VTGSGSESGSGSGPGSGPGPGSGSFDAPPSSRCNLLILSLASFCLICFGVWLIHAGKRYREDHAPAAQGWRVGSTRPVEITLVREDRQTLACVSNQVVSGLRCGGARDGHEGGLEPEILQPYNTVGNEIFLGAGLWSSLTDSLPTDRFTVICNFNVKGFIKSATIRFGAAGVFTPLGKITPVGTLTDCTIPR
jgi:hypothetical protein